MALEEQALTHYFEALPILRCAQMDSDSSLAPSFESLLQMFRPWIEDNIPAAAFDEHAETQVIIHLVSHHLKHLALQAQSLAGSNHPVEREFSNVLQHWLSVASVAFGKDEKFVHEAADFFTTHSDLLSTYFSDTDSLERYVEATRDSLLEPFVGTLLARALKNEFTQWQHEVEEGRRAKKAKTNFVPDALFLVDESVLRVDGMWGNFFRETKRLRDNSTSFGEASWYRFHGFCDLISEYAQLYPDCQKAMGLIVKTPVDALVLFSPEAAVKYYVEDLCNLSFVDPTFISGLKEAIYIIEEVVIDKSLLAKMFGNQVRSKGNFSMTNLLSFHRTEFICEWHESKRNGIPSVNKGRNINEVLRTLRRQFPDNDDCKRAVSLISDLYGIAGVSSGQRQQQFISGVLSSLDDYLASSMVYGVDPQTRVLVRPIK